MSGNTNACVYTGDMTTHTFQNNQYTKLNASDLDFLIDNAEQVFDNAISELMKRQLVENTTDGHDLETITETEGK